MLEPVDAARPGEGARSLLDLIRGAGLLSPESAARAELAHTETGEPIETVATRLGLISEQALAAGIAKALALPLATAADFPAERAEGRSLSAPFLHDRRVIPLALDGDGVRVAIANPLDSFALDAMRFSFGARIRPVVAAASDIGAAIDRLYAVADSEKALDAVVDEDDLDRLKDLVSDAPVIRAVNKLIAQAVDAHASDIHVEPTDDRLLLRFRIDGVLHDVPPLPAAMRAPFVSRVKIMAGLNIAERRLPQDGRLRLAVRGHEIDLRVATAPSIHGESVVMRILDKSNLALDFETLGFEPALVATLREALRKPYGIVLVTGPTGSGKTTTLYAALTELNRRSSKLLTIEDPIEYRLPGVIQAQVNPAIGFTFASALRSFLRQDPDVMMVGEIRDQETAQIAVQAALTGHMILSTLHTNTAAGAVTRLLDMAVEPFLLSSVLTAVLAQRLVRRLCTACREPYEPDALALEPLGACAQPRAFHRPVGCPACGGSGYRGRIALTEVLVIDEAIGRLVLQRADTREIARAGEAAGMRTLLADGMAKAAGGLTSLEEVLRVSSGN
ncbi:MAG: type II secretion system protein GspE [Sphingomonadales bacterium 32-68-7]|nr:MAG: type II secretion system protein GspE [Sphingomonadales bacterium 12-68-11]OYX10642.1 MAG: type II secretion system protein GspE [Sphingomonadales bacterium 32-68-7]